METLSRHGETFIRDFWCDNLPTRKVWLGSGSTATSSHPTFAWKSIQPMTNRLAAVRCSNQPMREGSECGKFRWIGCSVLALSQTPRAPIPGSRHNLLI